MLRILFVGPFLMHCAAYAEPSWKRVEILPGVSMELPSQMVIESRRESIPIGKRLHEQEFRIFKYKDKDDIFVIHVEAAEFPPDVYPEATSEARLRKEFNAYKALVRDAEWDTLDDRTPNKINVLAMRTVANGIVMHVEILLDTRKYRMVRIVFADTHKGGQRDKLENRLFKSLTFK